MAFNSDLHALLKATKKASRPVADAIEREKAKLLSDDGIAPVAPHAVQAPDPVKS